MYDYHPPRINQWYLNKTTHERFKIVGVDKQADSIVIQYFEGEIEEIDTSIWEQLALDCLPAQEDVRGAIEVTREDLNYSDDAMQSNLDPLNKPDKDADS